MANSREYSRIVGKKNKLCLVLVIQISNRIPFLSHVAARFTETNWVPNFCHLLLFSHLFATICHYIPRIVPKCLGVINVHSLVKSDAVSPFYAELTCNWIDICFVSETWLHKNVPTSMVCAEGYLMIRKDRGGLRIGGGVAVIYRND